jgi:hypothetical protein
MRELGAQDLEPRSSAFWEGRGVSNNWKENYLMNALLVLEDGILTGWQCSLCSNGPLGRLCLNFQARLATGAAVTRHDATD